MYRIIYAVLLSLWIAGLISVGTSHAGYIDPNTGGMIFQLLAVSFAILSGVILFFSARIKMAFARIKRKIRERKGENAGSDVKPESDVQ